MMKESQCTTATHIAKSHKPTRKPKLGKECGCPNARTEKQTTKAQHAVYFIAEIVLKSTAVARFKLHHGLTVTCSEIGNKNIPLSVMRSL